MGNSRPSEVTVVCFQSRIKDRKSANICVVSIVTDRQEKYFSFSTGHQDHLELFTFNEAEKLNFKLLFLSAHCSHELQPLDKSFLHPYKIIWE
jgi:hypothetical protein